MENISRNLSKNESNKKKKKLFCWRCNRVGHCKRDYGMNLGNHNNKKGDGNSGANGCVNGSSGQVREGRFFSNIDNPNQNYIMKIIF